jgi:zinc transporter ZupT
VNLLISLIAIGALALVHVYVGELKFLEGTPRSAWLSIAGGVSVAYVFVHLLPELNEAQENLAETVGEALSAVENHIYLIALLGLAIFYGLERAALNARRRQRSTNNQSTSRSWILWLHVASFGAYNALIGYLLHERALEGEERTLALFAIAMGLHFVAIDYGLREHYRQGYEHFARWVFGAMLLLGWVVGWMGEVSEATRSVLLAFLAGGVILNVLKEELPEERESRFWAFVIGAGAYTALLLAM